MTEANLIAAYQQALLEYCTTHAEDALYRASEISANLINSDMGPDEIVALHYDAVQAINASENFRAADRIRILNDAHQFLLEVMIGYGARYKEFLDLKLDVATRRAEDAEQSERDKLEILAMIAHELGNPLTVAIGNMRIASRFLETEDVVAMRDLITDSRTALDRLASLTRQIITASRGSQTETEFEPVNVVPVMKQAVAWSRIQAESKGLSVEECYAVDHLFVEGNSDELLSLFTNLMTNAVRYTVDGKIKATISRRNDEAVVAVHDTGIGIAEDDQARIFDKFFRSSDAKTHESGGLGMGLAIANGIARSHSGTIHLCSKPGEGSTFTVTLPAIPEELDDSE